MLEAGITTFILANGPLTAIISDRLYPDVLPQSPTLPALVYQVLPATLDYSHDGDSHLDRVRVQFSCWATSPTSAANLRETLRLALSGFSGQMGTAKVPAVFIEDQGGGQDEATGLFRKIVDGIFWHQSI